MTPLRARPRLWPCSDATCEQEGDDTNTPGDVAFIQAHQPADPHTTHQEVKEENKEEHTFTPVSVSQQVPVSATKPKFAMAGERDVRAHTRPAAAFLGSWSAQVCLC